MPDLPVLILIAVNTQMNRKVLIKHLLKMSGTKYNIIASQGCCGSGVNGYLFSGSWGALVIILGELGSKLIIWGI